VFVRMCVCVCVCVCVWLCSRVVRWKMMAETPGRCRWCAACGKRDLKYGKRDLKYGKRDLKYGKRNQQYHNSDLQLT
jgi:hypothetical protein